MRVEWQERNPRAGWDVQYTPIGGRTATDPISQLEKGTRAVAYRATSQAFVATTTSERSSDADTAYWATVCRKLIQRGTNPVMFHSAIRNLESSPQTHSDVLNALAGTSNEPDLDAAHDLHPVFEIPFWRRIAASNPKLTRWLIPQASLEGLAGETDTSSSRWVDFLLYVPWDPRPAVIEIDGSGHERRQGIDLIRDDLLKQAGVPVVRIKGSEVQNEDSPTIRRLEEASPASTQAPEAATLQAIHGPAATQRLAYAIVEAAELGLLLPGTRWSIRLTDPLALTQGLEPVALDLISSVDAVWNTDIVPPSIVINDTEWNRGQDGRFGSSEAAPTSDPTVEIRIESLVAPHAPLPRGDLPTIVIRGALLPVDLTWTQQTSTERRDRQASPQADEALDRLLTDIYGHGSFQEGQKPAIGRVLSGGDTCVLLPTGAGKSLIYQVAGLLRPGVTLIVAPLVSLIDDQQRRLEDSGIDRVIGLHSGTAKNADDKTAIQHAIAAGESLFVLVAPERLQIQEFREHLYEAAAHQLINLAVVDEAHCVSEWGHQFRTSYLKLGRNLRRFCAGDDDVPPPILALTATASPRVLNDLLNELGLDRDEPGVLHRPSTFDRPNLHYRILRGTLAQREANVRDALRLIATELGVTISDLADPRGEDTLSGIVFVPHASSGLGLGVLRYRDEIADELGGVNRSVIALFAGTKPKKLSTRSWVTDKAEYAEAFRTNEMPIMVSTNAFGMGIDKPNIRYTIHVTQPSSIEAYAQEAGRSGRDGSNSYCYLVSSNNPGIDESTIDNKANANLSYAKDDILIQLGNLMSSFPAADEEKESAREVLNELMSEGEAGRQVSVPLNLKNYPNTPQGNRAKETERRDRERAIYRLLLLGVVDDYTIEYGARSFTVYLTKLDTDAILATGRDLITTMAGGNRRATAPLDGIDTDSFDDAVPAALDLLIDTLYATVEPARTNALREMYLMTRLDDPEAIREKINAYLSEGPVSLILDKVVRSESSLADALKQLTAAPPSTDEEWAGAAARYLDAYAGHPVLLVVRALGEAWRNNGSRTAFQNVIERLTESLSTFDLASSEQRDLLYWMLDQLRTYFRGERWAWAPDIWGALEESSIPFDVLEPLEDHVLNLCSNGEFHRDEVATVVAMRLRRAESATKPAVEHLTRTG